MLVLTRRPGEKLLMGEGDDLITADDLITVIVLGVKGEQVRLGIDAPKGITIMRSELVDKEADDS